MGFLLYPSIISRLRYSTSLQRSERGGRGGGEAISGPPRHQGNRARAGNTVQPVLVSQQHAEQRLAAYGDSKYKTHRQRREPSSRDGSARTAERQEQQRRLIRHPKPTVGEHPSQPSSAEAATAPPRRTEAKRENHSRSRQNLPRLDTTIAGGGQLHSRACTPKYRVGCFRGPARLAFLYDSERHKGTRGPGRYLKYRAKYLLPGINSWLCRPSKPAPHHKKKRVLGRAPPVSLPRVIKTQSGSAQLRKPGVVVASGFGSHLFSKQRVQDRQNERRRLHQTSPGVSPEASQSQHIWPRPRASIGGEARDMGFVSIRGEQEEGGGLEVVVRIIRVVSFVFASDSITLLLAVYQVSWRLYITCGKAGRWW